MTAIAANTQSIKSVSPLLQVKDLRQSIAFYTTRLGFTEDFFDGDGFAIVRRGGCFLFLAQKQVDADLRNQTARATQDGYASYDLHFHCDRGSIDALWAEYRSAGVPMPPAFDDGPVDRDYGVRDFSITDPDGYDLVFGAPCDAVAG